LIINITKGYNEMSELAKGICIYSILLLLILIYYVLGIVYLESDKKLWDDCKDSFLWIYVIVSMVLMLLTKGFIVYSLIYNKIILRIVLIVLDIGLIIWGGFELYGSRLCEGLETSNLWDIGIASFLINITFYKILGLILIVDKCFSISSSENTIKPIDREEIIV
jgi:hypothetical protein